MPPIALVTGATSGFGAAITRALLRAGHRVIATGRRPERLEALAAEAGPDLLPIRLEVRDRAAVFALPDSLPAEWRPVVTLVANAGLALGLDPADRADPDDWEEMIDTNIKGLTWTIRAFLPQMVAAGGGHVVTIGSVAATYPYPGGNVYGATKAYVAQLTLNLRADLVDKRVRVTDIQPGLAETEFSLVRFKGDAARAAAVYEGLEAIQAEDVAEAVLWALSRPSRVNINRIELMAGCQAFGPLRLLRGA
jgi:3-hydroxy acid dehydrogenase/malonic semialdehyde reductase